VTVTLDGKTLNVRSLSEDFKVLNSQSDGWQSGAYTRKIKPIGIIRVWTVECFENAVAWASCQAKSFEDIGQAGSTVTFAITDEARVLNTTVLILGVTIGPLHDLGGKNIRDFTLTLQETTYTLPGGAIATPASNFAKGECIISAGNTSVVASHTLGTDPSAIVVSPVTDCGGKRWKITAHNDTNFTLEIDSAYTADITFDFICA
jgi:hypothetical protein